MSIIPNFRIQDIAEKMKLLPEIKEEDPNWRYRYLQERPSAIPLLRSTQSSDSHTTPLTNFDWLGQTMHTKSYHNASQVDSKENNKNTFNEIESLLNKENGAASAVLGGYYSTQGQGSKYTPEELETMSRLEIFQNLSLNNGWDASWTFQPQVSSQSVTPTAPSNYQYNPKSTVTRVRGCLAWDGYLPPRADGTPFEYSKKVFLGGVPWDISEQQLELIFSRYGDFKVEWPNNFNSKRNTTKSFLYLIFESLTSITGLLADCSKEQHGGSVTYNYGLVGDNISSKPFQVIPWIVSDNTAIYRQQSRLDNKLTVFVGALHGRLYAQALGRIFEELFHDVAYVQIDTDRYKYPIGSGRVTFSSIDSYRKAVEENFLTIIAPKFSKRIQIEPYIEDEPCGKCKVISAPNFCKSRLCFDYFCDNCWGWHHSIEGLKNHVPVKRNRKIERY